MTLNKHQSIRKLLLRKRSPRGVSRPWMSDLNGKQSANKFMLASILNYQMNATQVWDNAQRFAEKNLKNPRDLWPAIIKIRKWNTPTVFRRYQLHRFPAAHQRVRRIGNEIVGHYKGDARKIWENQTPNEVLNRLNRMRVGQKISRMIIGALSDTKQIAGVGELAPDIHVRRVLGRVFNGEVVSANKAILIAEEMEPHKSWMLDRPLYSLGKSVCKRTKPKCADCYLREKCIYYRATA